MENNAKTIFKKKIELNKNFFTHKISFLLPSVIRKIKRADYFILGENIMLSRLKTRKKIFKNFLVFSFVFYNRNLDSLKDKGFNYKKNCMIKKEKSTFYIFFEKNFIIRNLVDNSTFLNKILFYNVAFKKVKKVKKFLEINCKINYKKKFLYIMKLCKFVFFLSKNLFLSNKDLFVNYTKFLQVANSKFSIFKKIKLFNSKKKSKLFVFEKDFSYENFEIKIDNNESTFYIKYRRKYFQKIKYFMVIKFYR